MLQLERITRDQNNGYRGGNKRIKRSRTREYVWRGVVTFYKEEKLIIFFLPFFHIWLMSLRMYIRRVPVERNYKPSFITLLLLSARLVFVLLFFIIVHQDTHKHTSHTFFPPVFTVLCSQNEKKSILSVKHSAR